MFLLVRCLSETSLLAVNTCGIKKKDLQGKPLFFEVFGKIMKYINLRRHMKRTYGSRDLFS
jgi:hypothetical protein